MNTENIEDKKLKDAYIGHYQGQLDKAESILVYLIIISAWNSVSIALIYILPDQLQYLPTITSILGSIFSTCFLYWILLRIKNKKYILAFILLIVLIYLGILPVLEQHIVAFAYTITFAAICLWILYRCSEKNSLDDAHNVVQYIKSHKSEDHTAVILEHNENRVMDDGDKNVLPLIKVLNEYEENFQIYFCLYEDKVVKVLLNPHAKRIWIFGHGKKGGFTLTDKFFSYENFMKEHSSELREIGPREYVYQCHCNTGSEKPLTDCLLNERKGKLDPNVDNMPNYFDTGLADMELDDSIKSKCLLGIAVRLCSTFGKIPYIDLNYNCSSSVEHIIMRYEAHLEKKSKL